MYQIINSIYHISGGQQLVICLLLSFLISLVNSSIGTIISYRKYRKAIFNLAEGRILNKSPIIPLHSTLIEDYLKSKNKVKNFIDVDLTKQPTELKLNQDDLNNLYTKGVILDEYDPRGHLYYQIKDDLIYEISIQGGWYYFIVIPYSVKVKEIDFCELEEYYKIIASSNSEIEDNATIRTLSQSRLILYLFGASESPDRFPLKLKKTVEYQRALMCLEKIKSVEINNGYLIIRS